MVARTSRDQPRPGRPSKLNAEKAEAIVKAVEQGNTFDVAARSSGVGITTFKRWMQRGRSKKVADKDFRSFRAAIRDARARAEANAIGVIAKAATDDWRAAAWYLERSRPLKYGRIDRVKAEHSLSVPQGPAIDIEAARRELADPELARLQCEMDARRAQLMGGPAMIETTGRVVFPSGEEQRSEAI